jgi:hypothetical protein
LASLQAISIFHFLLKELESWPGLRNSEAASLTYYVVCECGRMYVGTIVLCRMQDNS